jgi:hypothetical protein
MGLLNGVTVLGVIVAIWFNIVTVGDLREQIRVAEEQAQIARDQLAAQEIADLASRIRESLQTLYACDSSEPGSEAVPGAGAGPPAATTCRRPTNAPTLRSAALEEFLTLSYRRFPRPADPAAARTISADLSAYVRDLARMRETPDPLFRDAVPLSALLDRASSPVARIVEDCRQASSTAPPVRLPHLNLSGLRLDLLLFCRVDLEGAVFEEADVRRSIFVVTDLSHATIKRTGFSNVLFVDTNFQDANADGATLNRSMIFLTSAVTRATASLTPGQFASFQMQFAFPYFGAVRLQQSVLPQQFYQGRCTQCQRPPPNTATTELIRCAAADAPSSASAPGECLPVRE